MLSGEVIIADSSPLIALARIGHLQLLPKLAKQVVVPRAVWAEATNVQDAPGAQQIISQTPWLEVRAADSLIVAPLLILVGRGEAEAIALAQREASAILLLDDLRARKLAHRLNLRRMGTVALLGQAKQAGLIEKLKPCLEALIANGIYMSQEIMEAVLKEVSE
jgi:uncharacterized protein